MSIYGGFATRYLETQYSLNLCKMLHLCQINLLSLLKNGKNYLESIDISRLSGTFNKIMKNLKSLESQKFLEPKFSNYCLELSVYFGSNAPSKPPIAQSISSKNFDMHFISDAFTFEDSKRLISVSPKVQSIVRSNSTRQARYNTRRASRKNFFISSSKGIRPTSTRPTSSPVYTLSTANANRSRSFVSKSHKNSKINPRHHYQDQAMNMIYANLDRTMHV